MIKGVSVEREHDQSPATDVVQNAGDLMKIAMAHLDEMPDYYTKLDAMENEGRFVTEKELLDWANINEEKKVKKTIKINKSVITEMIQGFIKEIWSINSYWIRWRKEKRIL